LPLHELFLRLEPNRRRRFESAEDVSLKVEVASEEELVAGVM